MNDNQELMPPMVDPDAFLRVILCLGRAMITCGSEIRRVEDTMSRILTAYGITEYDLHSIASQIVITYRAPDGRHYTQSVRVGIPSNNLGKLEKYNAYARQICRETPEVSEIEKMLASVPDTPYGKYARFIEWLGYLLGAGGFCMFFGGSLRDALAACCIACVIFGMDHYLQLRSVNQFLYTLTASLTAGCLSILLVRLSVGEKVDHVMMGTIMLFIPTLNMTNGIRELLNADIMTGFRRFSEALIVALAIAIGYVVSVTWLGGIL